jgi:hypothetical protein
MSSSSRKNRRPWAIICPTVSQGKQKRPWAVVRPRSDKVQTYVKYQWAHCDRASRRRRRWNAGASQIRYKRCCTCPLPPTRCDPLLYSYFRNCQIRDRDDPMFRFQQLYLEARAFFRQHYLAWAHSDPSSPISRDTTIRTGTWLPTSYYSTNVLALSRIWMLDPIGEIQYNAIRNERRYPGEE